MEEIIGFLFKWVLGPIVAIFVTLMFQEPVRRWLAPIAARFGLWQDAGLNGVWKATFYYGVDEIPFTEIIEIKSFLGQIVGHVIADERNHGTVAAIANEKPLRLIGSIKNNTFFTGVWYHPNKRNHHHGVYKLLIPLNQESMDGSWIGYSESQKSIETGRWEWKKDVLK